MQILQICPPHLSYVATLPWEIQKSHFSALLFIYFRLFTLLQKKTNSNCCTAAVAVYLLLFSAFCIALVLRLGHATGGALKWPILCWCAVKKLLTTGGARVYWYGHVATCGSGLLRHGLNFSTAWCTIRLTSVEKDWKHVLTQKVVTLNTCCDTVCLTFHS